MTDGIHIILFITNNIKVKRADKNSGPLMLLSSSSGQGIDELDRLPDIGPTGLDALHPVNWHVEPWHDD